MLTGQVLAQCKPRHRHQEFLSFLCPIEAAVPTDLDVHLIVDHYATHKHPKVKAWLAARPRWHGTLASFDGYFREEDGKRAESRHGK